MTAARCGIVAVVGEPNAGKSSFINRLLGTKVSIVSPKAQTTRAPLTAIWTDEKRGAQVIFRDTAGLTEPKRRLEKSMMAAAIGRAREADCLLFMAAPILGVSAEIAEKLRALGRPVVGAVNQIDAAPKLKTADTVAAMEALGLCKGVFPISAKTGLGIDALMDFLVPLMPESHFLYDDAEQVSDQSERAFAAEITREKLFLFLHDELPYQLTVETDSWQERPDGAVRVEQTVFVARESYRKIILGAGGALIKKIGTAARVELTEALGRPIHLFLFVKVREGWLDDPARFRAMGLDHKA
ncbi:GTPase Era [Alphaproteobacteria bacterium]|nr:GTPase Era [Alphaproteobacteria bacterium]